MFIVMTPLIENHQSVKTDRCINVISRKRVKGVRYLILTTLIVATVIRIIVSIHLITLQYFIHSIRLFLWKTAPRNFTRIAVLTIAGLTASLESVSRQRRRPAGHKWPVGQHATVVSTARYCHVLTKLSRCHIAIMSDRSTSKHDAKYDTIRYAILTCARKQTRVNLIYRTETTTKSVKQKN